MISRKTADRTGLHTYEKNTKKKVLADGETSVQKNAITLISREILLRVIKRLSEL